ncbi:MAG: response regulator [Gemmatimonadales bacterium]
MSRGTILIVDDEAALRRVLERVLTRDGYEVLSAGSGEAALELLDAHDVDMVLMDLRMPGMSGLTLYHAIASRWPPLIPRLAVMTGDPEDESLKEWLGVNNPPVIPKPFEVAEVLRLVDQLSQWRREANRKQ